MNNRVGRNPYQKPTSFQRHIEFRQAVHNALKVATTPTNNWTGGAGAIAHHIRVLEGLLRRLDAMSGDELRTEARRYFVSKPELREAIAKLRLIEELRERHAAQRDEQWQSRRSQLATEGFVS